MNIIALQTFLTVVGLGNLNKAAERLNVTQSTISARIDALEDGLGQKLLVRSRKGAQMTKAGFALQRHAEIIVQTWESGRRAIDIPDQFDAQVSISCEHDLWEGSVELWLSSISEHYPRLAMEIWPGAHVEIEAWLQSGLIDVAVTRIPISGHAIESALFEKDHLALVQHVDTGDNARAINIDHGPELRRTLVGSQKSTGLTFGLGSNRWALDKILKGGFKGYLPQRMVAPYIRSGDLFVIETDQVFETESFISWRRLSAIDHPWIKR